MFAHARAFTALVLLATLILTLTTPAAAQKGGVRWDCPIKNQDFLSAEELSKESPLVPRLFRYHRCDLPVPVYYDGGGAASTCYNAASLVQTAIDTWNAAWPDGDLLVYAGTKSADLVCTYHYDFTNVIGWFNVSNPIGQMCHEVTAGTDDIEADIRMARQTADCTGSPDMDEYDYLTVLLHEMGHMLGLGHSDEPGSIMLAYYLGGTTQHTLAPIDITSIQTYYSASALANDELLITGLTVTPTFDAGNYTWDVQYTFQTNLSTTASVDYAADMVCYPPLVGEGTVNAAQAINHSLLVQDLPAATSYDYTLEAVSSDLGTGCVPEETGSVALENGNDPIYAINASADILDCEVDVDWYTKYPSQANQVLYRLTGAQNWSTASATQANCIIGRYYTASFPIQPGNQYEYKVRTSIDGSSVDSSVHTKKVKWCASNEKQPASPATALALGVSAAPNPFNPRTTLVYAVPEDGYVELNVYAVSGELVRALVAGEHARGVHEAVWDGRDATGAPVASGIYFASITGGGTQASQKLVLLK